MAVLVGPKKPQKKGVFAIVTKVYDGDTIAVKIDEGQNFIIRLKYIDAPEKSQLLDRRSSIGLESKNVLQDLVSDKRVFLKGKKVDVYGRLLAELFYQDKSINLQMAERGMAYLYPTTKFPDLSMKTRYKEAVIKAQVLKRGIWSGKVTRPWSFRRSQKRKKFHLGTVQEFH